MINYKLKFNYLKQYDNILVSGCPRSGTRIGAKIIAQEIGYEYVDEAEFHHYHMGEFVRILDDRDKIVVHCPALSSIIHRLDSKDTFIVFMRRDPLEILESMKRVNFREEDKLWVLKRYGEFYGKLPSVIYDYWNNYQRHFIDKYLELDYESLSEHELWLTKDKRQNFNWYQTSVQETK